MRCRRRSRFPRRRRQERQRESLDFLRVIAVFLKCRIFLLVMIIIFITTVQFIREKLALISLCVNLREGPASGSSSARRLREGRTIAILAGLLFPVIN